jgi:hypothetical protein
MDKRVLCRLLAGIGLLLIGTFARPSIAQAGEHGQQLEITSYAGSVYIAGTGQDGYDAGQCFDITDGGNYHHWDSDWWWQDATYVWSYETTDCSGDIQGFTSAWVPSKQDKSSWFNINVPPF